MDSDPPPHLSALVLQGLSSGLHVGAQAYASLNGRVIIDAAWGVARDGVSMSTNTLMLWLSSGKPVTAVAVAQQRERGRLDWDDPVARHIPEFAAYGKESVTIRHLLTHTGGFRSAGMNFSLDPWEVILRRICDCRIERDWIPGEKAGYHIAGSWYVLAEIVRRLDGRSFDRYVREEIFLPLGMNDCWIGMPGEQYRAYGDRMGFMHDTSQSAQGQSPPVAEMREDTEAGCAVGRPGSSARGPIRELGFFYEMILGRGKRNAQGKNSRILSPESVQALTSRQRVDMFDHTFKRVMDWGLGFILNSKTPDAGPVPYSFGGDASPETVGHGGSQSSVGLADPAIGLAAAIVFNGRCGEIQHALRMREAMAALYEDLKR